MRKFRITLLLSLLLCLPGLTIAKDKPDPELRKLLHQAVSESDSFVDRFEAEVWLMDMSNRLSKKSPAQ